MSAASATLQSCFFSPVDRAGSRTRTAGLTCTRCLPSKRAVHVRCQAEEKQPLEEQPPAASAMPPQPTQTPPPPPPPKAATKVSTKFSDVLAFSGPAPERINGRLAMLGFVAAVGAELASGNDLAAQLADGGLTWFLATAVVFSAASLVPLFKGVSVQSKSGGVMSADAEMWNGRFAMLGLVALAFTEYVKGGPLV